MQYETPMMEIEVIDKEDVVRTSDDDYGMPF